MTSGFSWAGGKSTLGCLRCFCLEWGWPLINKNDLNAEPGIRKSSADGTRMHQSYWNWGTKALGLVYVSWVDKSTSSRDRSVCSTWLHLDSQDATACVRPIDAALQLHNTLCREGLGRGSVTLRRPGADSPPVETSRVYKGRNYDTIPQGARSHCRTSGGGSGSCSDEFRFWLRWVPVPVRMSKHTFGEEVNAELGLKEVENSFSCAPWNIWTS